MVIEFSLEFDEAARNMDPCAPEARSLSYRI